jgi:hypothetical protein
MGGGNGINNAAGGRVGGQNTGIGPYGGGQLNGTGAQGDSRRIDQPYAGDLARGPVTPTPAQSEAAYSDLMRDLGRLRNGLGDDKDLSKEYQQLVQQAQQLDPKRWATNGQLNEVINSQLANAIDEVELLLRRKLDANDGSVRSATPAKAPPGYAEAYREYTKRLSKQ